MILRVAFISLTTDPNVGTRLTLGVGYFDNNRTKVVSQLKSPFCRGIICNTTLHYSLTFLPKSLDTTSLSLQQHTYVHVGNYITSLCTKCILHGYQLQQQLGYNSTKQGGGGGGTNGVAVNSFDCTKIIAHMYVHTRLLGTNLPCFWTMEEVVCWELQIHEMIKQFIKHY